VYGVFVYCMILEFHFNFMCGGFRGGSAPLRRWVDGLCYEGGDGRSMGCARSVVTVGRWVVLGGW
jgi:hypothetical protein